MLIDFIQYDYTIVNNVRCPVPMGDIPTIVGRAFGATCGFFRAPKAHATPVWVDPPVRQRRTLRGDVGGVLVEGGVFDDYFVVG